MTTNTEFYVYEHWRPDTDTCFYVGKGRNRRAYMMRDRGKYHQNVLNKLAKNGICAEIKLVAESLTEEEAFVIERKRIAFWRSAGINLANRTDGGDGVSGLIHSEDSRKKMSESKKGKPVAATTLGMKFSEETRAKMSAAKIGKKPNNFGKECAKRTFTEETKIKMRNARLGRKLSDETKKKLSELRKGKKRNEEFREKIRLSWVARKNKVSSP